MPNSADHQAISQTLAAWRQGHNPDGRRGSGELDMPADLSQRMMRGEISPAHSGAEWRGREPGQRAFNDRLRREALGGFTADAEQVLAGTEGAPVTASASNTGRFADLDEAMRAAGSKSMPGGITPTEIGPPVDPNAQLRAA